MVTRFTDLSIHVCIYFEYDAIYSPNKMHINERHIDLYLVQYLQKAHVF
jgi:hypothetical protein